MSEDSRMETCRIVFWRGYVKCAFYAVPGEGEPIGSPFFRSRERSPLHSGKPLAAYEALVERLVAEGWEPATRGRAWYSLTFRRRDWSPVEEDFPLEQLAPPEPAVEAHAAPPEPEPEPVILAEPVAAAAPPVERTSKARRPRLLLGVTALLGLSVVLGLTLLGTSPAQGNARTRPELVRSVRHVSHQRTNVAAPAARQPAKPVLTQVVLTAARGDSWIEARAGSSAGRSLYAGVLEQGQTMRFKAPAVWLSAGAAGNIDLSVDGRAAPPGSFNGTLTVLATHGRVQTAA